MVCLFPSTVCSVRTRSGSIIWARLGPSPDRARTELCSSQGHRAWPKHSMLGSWSVHLCSTRITSPFVSREISSNIYISLKFFTSLNPLAPFSLRLLQNQGLFCGKSGVLWVVCLLIRQPKNGLLYNKIDDDGEYYFWSNSCGIGCSSHLDYFGRKLCCFKAGWNKVQLSILGSFCSPSNSASR